MRLRLEVLVEGMLLPGGSGGRASGGAGAAAGVGLVCAAPTGALTRVGAAGAGAAVGVRCSAVVPVGRGPPSQGRQRGGGGCGCLQGDGGGSAETHPQSGGLERGRERVVDAKHAAQLWPENGQNWRRSTVPTAACARPCVHVCLHLGSTRGTGVAVARAPPRRCPVGPYLAGHRSRQYCSGKSNFQGKCVLNGCRGAE